MGCWKRISFKHGDYNLKILGVFYQKRTENFLKLGVFWVKTRRVFAQFKHLF